MAGCICVHPGWILGKINDEFILSWYYLRRFIEERMFDVIIGFTVITITMVNSRIAATQPISLVSVRQFRSGTKCRTDWCNQGLYLS
jgi:hypothetical protein